MPRSLVFDIILRLWLALTVCFILSQVVVFNYLRLPHLPVGHLSEANVADYLHYDRSCDDLFGVKSLRKTHQGKCLEHSLLKWSSCSIGSIVIDTSKIGGSLGGESIQSVLNRKVEDEFLNFSTGAVQLQRPVSEDVPREVVDPVIKSFLNSSILAAQTASEDISTNSHSTTLLIRRGGYANPCLAIISMYNTFVVQRFLLNKAAAQIVWLDGHARNDNMDAVWEQLFQTKPMHIKRLSDSESKLDDAVLVNTVSAMGDEGLGVYGWERDTSGRSDVELCKNSTLAMFRDFVLKRYDIRPRTKEEGDTSCRLTLLARKHHMSHPRSTGRTDRVLANVTDDIDYIQSEYPECEATAVSFEDITFRQQLEIVSQSDVFVSVHGAGNIHVMFLPSHGKLVEFFPKGFTRRLRFQYLAECLGVSYEARKAKIVERFADNKISVRLRPAKR